MYGLGQGLGHDWKGQGHTYFLWSLSEQWGRLDISYVFTTIVHQISVLYQRIGISRKHACVEITCDICCLVISCSVWFDFSAEKLYIVFMIGRADSREYTTRALCDNRSQVGNRTLVREVRVTWIWDCSVSLYDRQMLIAVRGLYESDVMICISGRVWSAVVDLSG